MSTPLSFACPWCHAAPGQRCTLGLYSLEEMRDYHSSRKEAAEEYDKNQKK